MDGGWRRLERRKPVWLRGLVVLLWLAAASGCAALPWGDLPATIFPSSSTADPSDFSPLGLTPAPAEGGTGTVQPSGTAALETGEAPLETPELPTVEGGKANVLRVWLPPQFDPNDGSPAGRLLRARLEAFAARYPEIRLEVRLKAKEGPGGLLAALSAASVSAPLTLPDVVALPRPLLETAALKGVIFQMDDLPVAEVGGFLTEPDWYPFAVQMGRLQDNTFGLPFAGDMLVVAARPGQAPEEQSAEAVAQPTEALTPDPELEQPFSAAWGRLFETGEVLAFPGADPQALFTLLLYRSLGGAWTDADGRPYLDPVPLAQVLALYQQASQAEVLPYWLSQYETGEQVWEAFENGEVDRAAVWASQALSASRQAEAPAALEPVPTLDGGAYTLATGWVWAVASPDPEGRLLAGELAAFLVERDFLAAWNTAAGYIPPRQGALAGWEPATWRDQVAELAAAAELLPPGDVLPVLGPPLRQVTVNVLKLAAEPAAAAQEAAAAIASP